jgi:GTPase SAR1 family protein
MFAREHKLTYVETSARTGFNVDECFLAPAKTVMANIEADVYDLTSDVTST